MSTTRRTILQRFAVLPVTALPTCMPQRAKAETADAELIALARRVANLARIQDVAQERMCEAQERYEKLEPASVVDDCRAEINGVWQAEWDACPLEAPDDVVQLHAKRAGEAAKLIKERHAALVAVNEEQCLRLRRDTGLERAEGVAKRLSGRLKAAAENLTALDARTMPGLVAKASAFVAVQDLWQCRDAWVVDLAESVTRDVAQMGSAA